MDDAQVISWLHRRVGFGLTPSELAAAASAGVDATVDRLVDPAGSGVPVAPDPWDGQTFGAVNLRPQAVEAIGRWVDQMAATSRPFEDWSVWFWHGHFATAVQKVRSPQYLIQQMRLFRQQGLGRFADLLRAVTIDPAMLVWLDGRESTGKTPNENYGREVLELFTLGIGNYQEADVRAGAKALTGWTVPKLAIPRVPKAAGDRGAKTKGKAGAGAHFLPAKHDDTPQAYLGRNGVHDLDTTVAAITSQPACPRFIVEKLATAVLGGVSAGQLDQLSDRFAASGLDLRDLARSVMGLGVEQARSGQTQPVVTAPVPWLATILHQTGVSLPYTQMVGLLGAAGQVPMNPPSVGGWPSGAAWFATATVSARYELAGAVSAGTRPDHPARSAAAAGDHTALAAALNHPEGFTPATTKALDQARSVKGPSGVAPLTIALVSPELVVS